MRGIFTDDPNLEVIADIKTGPPSTADIRLRMSENLSGITSLQAATSNGLFLRDDAGNNLVIVNATGTTTGDLLVDDRLETTGNTVVGGILAANAIKGNGDPQVTLDDNLDVTGELRCDTIKPSTALPNTMTIDAGILNTGHIIADGNISANNLDVGETFAVRTNTIQPQSGSTITADAGVLQTSAIVAKGNIAGRDIIAGSTYAVRTDTVVPSQAAVVTVDAPLTVNQDLTTMGIMKCIAITPTLGTVNIVSNDLLVQGDLQVSGSMPSPFWCAESVNTNGTIIVSAGRVSFTCEPVVACRRRRLHHHNGNAASQRGCLRRARNWARVPCDVRR
jgi:hypothetical protein